MDRPHPSRRRPRRAIRRAFAAAAVPLIGLALAVPGLAAGHTVQAVNFVYVAPGGGSSLTITAGDQVTWVASGDPHTVTSGMPGAIDDRFPDRPAAEGFLISGDSFTTTFSVPGTYPYFCEVHFETMTGTIIVVAAATPASTSGPTPVPNPAATPRPTPRPTPPPSAAPTPAPTSGPTLAVTPSPAASATERPSPSPSPTPSPVPSQTGVETAAPTGGSGTPTSNDGPGVLPIAIAGILVAGAVGGLLLARRRGTAQ